MPKVARPSIVEFNVNSNHALRSVCKNYLIGYKECNCGYATVGRAFASNTRAPRLKLYSLK